MIHYKFLDVGCKDGKSFTKIAKKYKYTPDQGIGIDINKDYVDAFIKTGNHAIVASAEELPFRDNSFELVICNHVLEHMYGEEAGFKALSECIRVSSKSIFIGLPFFDEDEYLAKHKLKTFYSDWTGHKNKVFLKEILEFASDKQVNLNMRKRISDSFAEEILPINSPRNSMEYNEKIHGIKNYVKFDREIWREYELVIIK